MTYYVEPDYWVAGYAVGDSTGTLIYGSGASSATGVALSGANYTAASLRGISTGYGTVVAAGDLIAIFPGIGLNAKSSMAGAGGIRTSSSSLIEAESSVKAGGRIFWEMTAPASGTWTAIVPQAEGSGE